MTHLKLNCRWQALVFSWLHDENTAAEYTEYSIHLFSIFALSNSVYRRGEHEKLHIERPQAGFEPGTFFLWADSANHHSTLEPYTDYSYYQISVMTISA